jgi:hypothetical protein
VAALWERIRYSLWIGWTLTIFFNWVGFLWIGFRTLNVRWIVWGVLYAVPPWGMVLVMEDDVLWEGWLGDLSLIATLLGGPISVVHAMAIRRAYAAKRRRMRGEAPPGERDERRARRPEPLRPVEVNSASEVELARLPGVGPVLAKRALAERDTRPFQSVEDFGEALELQPHMIERLRSFVRVEDPDPEREPARRRGRVVDY